MAKKRWVEVSLSGIGQNRREAQTHAEEAAIDLCIRLGLAENEIKVTACRYDGSDGQKAVGVGMMVYTGHPIDRFLLIHRPGRMKAPKRN